MKKYNLLALVLVGLMLVTAGCTTAPSTVEDSEVVDTTPAENPAEESPSENEDSQESQLPELDTIFEGMITSIDTDNKMVTIDMTSPYKDTIILIYGDDTEFAQEPSEMLRIGAMIRFETNGAMTASLPAQMSALKITDVWVAYDETEKIHAMFEGREKSIFSADRVEMEIQKGDEFLVQLHRNDALDSSWYWEVSDEGAFEYQNQAQYIEVDAVASLYQMKALKKGEHFLYFHEYDPATGENLRDISFQLFVMDATNTQGNIVELVGEVASVENETIILNSGDKQHWIYAPNMTDFGDFKAGDQLIVGAELGEASYKLAFATHKTDQKTESDLPIIQHVVQIEHIGDAEVDMLLNEALLTIYHNDIVNDSEMAGAYVYIEYAVDMANEANELLKIELIK